MTGLLPEGVSEVLDLLDELLALEGCPMVEIADKVAVLCERAGYPEDAARVRDARHDSDRLMTVLDGIGQRIAVES